MTRKGISISSRAPTRIDLCGGTLDIWPLYLFLEDPVTVNLGIDLFAEATLTDSAPSGAQGTIRLRSEDQNIETTLGWDDLKRATAHPALELHLKLLRHFAKVRDTAQSGTPSRGDLVLSTRAKSPAGAGLGGSSTLSIALVGALGSWARGAAIDPAKDGEKFIDIVRDVETTVIKVPAGLQDYYGAMYGGLQSLKWRPGSHRRIWLDDDLLPELEKRLLLFYSGQSRNSGINNWALFKGFIDKDAQVQDKFRRINEATKSLETALRARDWKGASAAIAEEWDTRRTLAPGISTPEIEDAFGKARKAHPGSSGKVCGAGGGGCFFVFLPEALPEAERTKLADSLCGSGIRRLPFTAVPRGLEIRIDA